MVEDEIILETKDGLLDCRTFFKNTQTFPPIIFYMDAPAIREELREMCRKLLLMVTMSFFQIYFIDMALREIILLIKNIIKAKKKN